MWVTELCTSWAIDLILQTPQCLAQSLAVGHSINAHMSGWMGYASNPPFRALLCEAGGALQPRFSFATCRRSDWGWAGEGLASSYLLADAWACRLAMACHPGSGCWFQCPALPLSLSFFFYFILHFIYFALFFYYWSFAPSWHQLRLSSTGSKLLWWRYLGGHRPFPSWQRLSTSGPSFKLPGSNNPNLCPLLIALWEQLLPHCFLLLFWFSNNCLTNTLY